jgi:hypothetical protein
LKFCFVAILAICALLLGGCDPGEYLRPTDWREVSPMVRATEVDGVELRARDIGGLVGQDYCSLDLEIVNPKHELFVVEGAKLRTNGEEYTAKAYKCCGDRDLTSPEFFWKFDRPLDEVFGRTGELDLDVRDAQSRRTMTVKLDNQSWLSSQLDRLLFRL